MMIGGEGSRRVVGGSLCKEAWEGPEEVQGLPWRERVPGGRRPMRVSDGRGRAGRRFRVDQDRDAKLGMKDCQHR